MNLPEFIRRLRFDLKLTQVKLANRLKMKQSTISGWENGTRALSANSLKKLEKFCHDNKITY